MELCVVCGGALQWPCWTRAKVSSLSVKSCVDDEDIKLGQEVKKCIGLGLDVSSCVIVGQGPQLVTLHVLES